MRDSPSVEDGVQLEANLVISHFYLTLALILSVLFSFTGILAFALMCTIPAAVCAKKVTSF